jgi:hypothetical protein
MKEERLATLQIGRIVARTILDCYKESEYSKFLPGDWKFDIISPSKLLWIIAYTCEKRLTLQFMDSLAGFR